MTIHDMWVFIERLRYSEMVCIKSKKKERKKVKKKEKKKTQKNKK